MNNKNKKTRTYKRITPSTVAKHQADVLIHGNDTAAVRETDIEYIDPNSRGKRIAAKSRDMPTLEYIDNSLQQIAGDAIVELNDLIHSEDEQVKTRNVHYVIDHIRGKATRKTEARNLNINIETVLE